MNTNVLSELIKKSDKNCNRYYRTINGVGTALCGNFYLATYNKQDFFLECSFITFLFLPIIPYGIYITYGDDTLKKIIGRISINELQKQKLSVVRIIFSGYMTAIFEFSYKIIALVLAFALGALVYEMMR